MKILMGILFAAYAAVAVHPIPVGVHLEANGSYAAAHCYYLHWDGIRKTDIDMSHAKDRMNGSVCWE